TLGRAVPETALPNSNWPSGAGQKRGFRALEALELPQFKQSAGVPFFIDNACGNVVLAAKIPEHRHPFAPFIFGVEPLEFAEIHLREPPLPAEIRLLGRDEPVDDRADSVAAELRCEVLNELRKPVKRCMV